MSALDNLLSIENWSIFYPYGWIGEGSPNMPPISEAYRELVSLKARIEELEDRVAFDDLEAIRVNLIEMNNINLQERIKQLEAERTWRPIESAPKSAGTEILVTGFGGTAVIDSYFSDNENITHWMPLPPAPKED